LTKSKHVTATPSDRIRYPSNALLMWKSSQLFSLKWLQTMVLEKRADVTRKADQVGRQPRNERGDQERLSDS
jgi:hypothetical protein